MTRALWLPSMERVVRIAHGVPTHADFGLADMARTRTGADVHLALEY